MGTRTISNIRLISKAIKPQESPLSEKKKVDILQKMSKLDFTKLLKDDLLDKEGRKIMVIGGESFSATHGNSRSYYHDDAESYFNDYIPEQTKTRLIKRLEELKEQDLFKQMGYKEHTLGVKADKEKSRIRLEYKNSQNKWETTADVKWSLERNRISLSGKDFGGIAYLSYILDLISKIK